MKKLHRPAFALAICLALTSHPALANMACDGTLMSSWVDTSGNVYIESSWRGHHTQICNIKAVWKGVSPDICLTWKAMVDSAVAMDRDVWVHYPIVIDCAAISTLSDAPAPLFVRLK